MGKLNIAHHKSYHPYRRDNIERVRRDEEEARRKEAKEEGRMMLADSEARIEQLRERSGIAEKSSKKKRKDEDLDKIIAEGSSTRGAVLPTTNGHINFFEDLEQASMMAAIRATKKAEPAETEKGVPLAPSAKDLKPWYSERSTDSAAETPDDRRKRDTERKSMHDPLTSITKELASRSSSSSSSRSFRRPLPPPEAAHAPPEVHSRLKRESSERERALELIRRKKREMAGSETPSTVHGGIDEGYGDVYNRREVEEAHRGRDRRWDSQDHDRRKRYW
ncbi:putative N-terminal domain of CBF1 interacting co-repressor CIR [Lyophyllum shimeji]|uniref:N-terminal domain of CBF1 interacting co-repressor CIR n=1 Tax=Lyophyllum shimeji TaxID=47721 RepID=A0A9P3PIM2_LYOSH|nr:putative N-terminal domain of CBF1 interacting co-repressor CIR [Lyophyllum shimeji]